MAPSCVISIILARYASAVWAGAFPGVAPVGPGMAMLAGRVGGIHLLYDVDGVLRCLGRGDAIAGFAGDR